MKKNQYGNRTDKCKCNTRSRVHDGEIPYLFAAGTMPRSFVDWSYYMWWRGYRKIMYNENIKLFTYTNTIYEIYIKRELVGIFGVDYVLNI